MAAINPLQIMMALKGGNPEQVARSLIQQNFGSDPMAQNLLRMGEQGNVQGIQQFAQQYFSQQGRDFNAEMGNFMNAIKNM